MDSRMTATDTMAIMRADIELSGYSNNSHTCTQPHSLYPTLGSVVDGEQQQPAAAAATTRYQEARLYLKPWYSPTNSYLQIDSPGGSTVECRSTLVLRVGYTTRAVPSTNHFTYTYQVSTWRWLAAWRSG